jgi:hypothetical protein
MKNVYAKTQFAMGTPAAKFNQITKKWYPSVGGAIKIASEHDTIELATKEAITDLENHNTEGWL